MRSARPGCISAIWSMESSVCLVFPVGASDMNQVCGQKERDLGDDLLSQTVASPVPSALTGLTAVFGMGTGVSPSLWSPKSLFVGSLAKKCFREPRKHAIKIPSCAASEATAPDALRSEIDGQALDLL